MPTQTGNDPVPSGERWLSVDEIMAHLGVARDTIYRWIEATREAGFDKTKLENGVLEPLRENGLID
jgi:hypothetical protein